MQQTKKDQKETINEIKIAYDVNEGVILGMITIKAPIERVFETLLSKDIIQWWIRPGVFDTTSWQGDVRVGGAWQTEGTISGQFYTLKGTYLELTKPTKLIHTYGEKTPWGPTTVSYKLESKDNDTLVILKHDGFTSPSKCEGNALGWETCFQALKKMLE